ncbi:hypothetical protein BDW71DRAFT_153752 [Aspergillus fruticulosus]
MFTDNIQDGITYATVQSLSSIVNNPNGSRPSCQFGEPFRLHDEQMISGVAGLVNYTLSMNGSRSNASNTEYLHAFLYALLG